MEKKQISGSKKTPHEEWVTSARGSVVDVYFPTGKLPITNEALDVLIDDAALSTFEVQQHLDRYTVRAVAMTDTAGISWGDLVSARGSPIEVTVGDEVLGRIINVLGEPVDQGLAFSPDAPRWPIHRPSPLIADQKKSQSIFQTGIKVIDLNLDQY